MASEADADAIVDVVNRAYRPSNQEKGWTHESELVSGPRTFSDQVLALFRPQSFVFVLCQDTSIIACVHIRCEDSVAFIGMFATEPANQGLGLGHRMLLHAETFAVTHCNAKLSKMTVLSSRAELIAFYERKGYARTGEIDSYPISAGVGQPIRKDLFIEVLVKNYSSHATT
jgi:ribosomal protein S18 acetylase RimI-like enzyme